MQRDMQGYGNQALQLLWPNNSKLAINFVLNYEEGSELTPLNGDKQAETYGGEFTLTPRAEGIRNLSMESLFEYGSRAGLWRLLRLFDENSIPLTCFITGLALTMNEEFAHYLRRSKHDIAGHGWRWIDHQLLGKKEEKQHIQQCVETIYSLTGIHPTGWYAGRRSQATREIVKELNCFLYDSDSYADDLPYFENEHLIIPYTLDCNDFRYTTTPGYTIADDFYNHLKNTFDYLYQENRLNLMTIGLHPRISGRPGRCIAVANFIHYIKSYTNIWITRRQDIATYWRQHLPVKHDSLI